MQDIRSTLDQLLEKYAVEEAFTFDAVHGFLTAQAICPSPLAEKERNEIIFDGEAKLSSEDANTLNQALASLKKIIDRDFNDEEGFTLSCEAELGDLDDEALFDWCGGFMESHFLNEDQWFADHEQEVCELLLPVMLGSGLFDEEPEFAEILKDDALAEDMYSQIPEVLMELYLLFNSPEENKPPKARPNNKPGHRKRR